MTRAVLAVVLLSATAFAWAGGPIAPRGWDGSFDPTLPNGEPCCIAADLNGTGLVGGAFVLLSANKREFGIFALLYTPPLKESWQLLERHPMSQLASYRVSVEPQESSPIERVRVCATNSRCVLYLAPSVGARLKRVETNAR